MQNLCKTEQIFIVCELSSVSINLPVAESILNSDADVDPIKAAPLKQKKIAI